jgi:hypothetical protein
MKTFLMYDSLSPLTKYVAKIRRKQRKFVIEYKFIADIDIRITYPANRKKKENTVLIHSKALAKTRKKQVPHEKQKKVTICCTSVSKIRKSPKVFIVWITEGQI